MRNLSLAAALLLLAPLGAHARGGGGRGFVGSRGGARSSGFAAARFAPAARGFGAVSRASSFGRSRAVFGSAVRRSTGFVFRRDAPTGGSGGASTQTPPPYYYTPGALIRTAGQLPVYSDPHDATTHAVDGGGFVAMNDRDAHSVGAAPSVQYGAPDRAPSSGGGGAGGNGVTTNGGAAFDPSF